MKPLGRLLLGLLALLSAGLATAAPNLQQLARQGQVRISAWVDAGAAPVVRQRVPLIIELSTPGWFSQGARLGPVAVEDALVLRQQKQAINYVERRDGQSWTIQRLEIALYPLRGGAFRVPPLAVELGIRLDGQNVAGNLLTTSLQFEARWPSSMLTADSLWLAADDYQARIEYSPPLGTPLKVGDALRVRILQQAQGTAANLLPIMPAPQVKGTRLYADPPRLSETAERGEYLAERNDGFTLLVQEGGELALPAVTLFWWRPERRSLERIELEGGRWPVRHTPASWLRAHGWLCALVVVAVVAAFLLVRGLHRRLLRNRLPLSLQFARALWRRDWPEANRLLYLRQQRLNRRPVLAPALLDAVCRQRYEAWSSNHFARNEASDRRTLVRLWRAVRCLAPHSVRALPRCFPRAKGPANPL